MKVKVCGITSYKDAKMALDQGVDALGFNFFPKSPRFISPQDARAIIRRLPVFTATVGVFVNEPESARIAAVAAASGVGIVQLHGDESPDYCRELGAFPLIKAIRIGKAGIPEHLDDFDVRAFLLDAEDGALYGGTGKSFDWSLAKDACFRRAIILAGGLRPDNVKLAIQTVRPYALDVCSGVEGAPGKKDAVKLMEFMNEVRNVGQSPYRS